MFQITQAIFMLRCVTGSGNNSDLDGGYLLTMYFSKTIVFEVLSIHNYNGFPYYFYTSIPNGYYNSAENKSDQALHSVIMN